MIVLAISAGSAFAADLPYKKAPLIIPPPPPPLWTGFYAGVNVGGTVDASSNTYVYNAPVFLNGAPAAFPTASAVSAAAAAAGTAWLGNNSSGFIGGGQVGYNYQFGAGGLGWGSGWVAGIEADIQGVAATGGGSNTVSGAPLGAPFPGRICGGRRHERVEEPRLSRHGARPHWLPDHPALLVYGTGGLAYGGVNSTHQPVPQGCRPRSPLLAAGSTPPGRGRILLQHARRLDGRRRRGVDVLPNWSAKVEYLYYDLGNATYGSGVSGLQLGRLAGSWRPDGSPGLAPASTATSSAPA